MSVSCGDVRLIGTAVKVLEKKQANEAGRVRELIDEQFDLYEDWVQAKSGDIDWVKRLRFNMTIVSHSLLGRAAGSGL